MQPDLANPLPETGAPRFNDLAAVRVELRGVSWLAGSGRIARGGGWHRPNIAASSVYMLPSRMRHDATGVRAVIGVPLYNGARHFERALGSLRAQRGVAFAIVLVDDGSTDDTRHLARRLADDDARVSYHENPKRLGLSRNWQRCLELACELHPEAEYFAWGSDHDWWDPLWLHTLVRALDEDDRAVGAHPGAVWLSEADERLRPVRSFHLPGAGRPVERLVRAGLGMTAGNMVYGLFRRSALTSAGGFPQVLLPDRLLLLRLALQGGLRQVDDVLWERRRTGTASLERQRMSIFPEGAPRWAKLPVWLVHAGVVLRDHALCAKPGGVLTRGQAVVAAASTVALAVDSKKNRRRMRRLQLRAWRARKQVRRLRKHLHRLHKHLHRLRKRLRRLRKAITGQQRFPWSALRRTAPIDRRAGTAPEDRRARRSGACAWTGVSPTLEAVRAAAERSPLRIGPAFTDLADPNELRFREEIEARLDPECDVTAFIERKQLPDKLGYVLVRAGIEPRGVVVDLGAGTCWLSAAFACCPQVERVIAVEFSRRRLVELAPIALAHLGAPAEKVERVLADFHRPGLPPGAADLVVTDAAFHHSADPARLAAVALELLRPGGVLLLHREPTLAVLRRSRDHGIEGQHGDFEREYTSRGYLRQLRTAGFVDARKIPAAGGFSGRRARTLLHPPLRWLNGIAFAEYAYTASRP